MNQIMKTVEQRLKPARLWLFVALFALAFAIQVLQINISLEFMLIVVLAVAVASDRKQLLGLMLCFIPLFSMIQYLYALAICMIVFVLKFHRELRWNHVVFVLGAMFFWELIHFQVSLGTVVSSVRVVAPIAFCCFLMMIDGSRFQYKYLVRTLSLAVIAVSVIVWLRCADVSEEGILGYIFNGNRLGIVRHSVQNIVIMNPNTWGFICLTAMTGLLQLLVSRKGSMFDIVLCGILFLIGALTQSKTFFLCLAIALVLFLCVLSRDKKTLIFRLTMLAVIGVVGLIIAWWLIPGIVKPLLERFVASDSNNLRIKIFWEYMEYLSTDIRGFIFGLGAWDLRSRVIQTFTDVPHNALQEIVAVWGIFGLAFFALFLYIYIHTSKKNNKNQKLVNYIPLILLLIKVQLGQFVTAGHTLLLFSFAYMSLCYDFAVPEKAQENGKPDIFAK